MKRVNLFLLLPFLAVACQDQGPMDPLDDEVTPVFAVDDEFCDSHPGHPKCPAEPEPDPDPEPDPGVWTEKVSGDYWMTVLRLPNWDFDNRHFWFTAEKYDDGSFSGEWHSERKSVDGGRPYKSSGEITCFTIVNDEVWIGGNQDGTKEPYNQVVWRVSDGDWNDGAPDASSLACNRLPDPGADYYPGCEELTIGYGDPDNPGYDAQRYCEEASIVQVPLLVPDLSYWEIVPENPPELEKNWWEYFPPTIDSGYVVIQFGDPESS